MMKSTMTETVPSDEYAQKKRVICYRYDKTLYSPFLQVINDTVRIVCGRVYVTVRCPSVRLSVPSTDTYCTAASR